MKSNKYPHVANLLFPSSVEDLFNQFWRDPTENTSAQSAWTPCIEVLETPDAYEVRAELPGVDPKTVELTVTGDSLCLAGQKLAAPESTPESETEAAPKVDLHLRERQYGAFSRTITFPVVVSTDEVVATTRHGVLSIRVAKAAGSQSRRIEIQGE